MGFRVFGAGWCHCIFVQGFSQDLNRRDVGHTVLRFLTPFIYRATSGLGAHEVLKYMGQFLVIGIATRIIANVNRQRTKLTIEDLRKSLEKKFNQSGIYDVGETKDGYVTLNLKPEVAEPEWEPLIKDFYKLRFLNELQEFVDFEELKSGKGLQEWLELADKRKYECYQSVGIYYGYEDKIDGWPRDISASMCMVTLSLDGKIVMECYGSVLGFFTRLIREKLSKYRLSESLFVDICG